MTKRTVKRPALFLLVSMIAFVCVQGQQPQDTSVDLTDPKQATLYVVGYAHLDTQWRWEYPQTISEFLPKTMHNNFALFEKYPHYIFNFSGANRYRLMKEYYPADFETLKKYVAAGRWFPAGSSMEEGDVNSPSAESIFRQILYGNDWFRREFGKASAEYMLPDCFGFPASLPSILAHAGVKGFSTQKLSWGSAAPVGGPNSIETTPRGIPFNVGMWIGPDGKSVIAALNPGDYSGSITEDISKSPPPPTTPEARKKYYDWPGRVAQDGRVSGVFADYHYYGTGDTGGSPTEASVKLVESIQTPTSMGSNSAHAPGENPLRVVSATADQMFLDIKPSQLTRLPTYTGDMELTNHSAGSLTSEAYQKRWNRKNELLGDAAEKASLAAEWLGARQYPMKRLNDAWTLVMGGHFHDIAAGTATPRAYEFSWNDDVIAMNQFASVLTSAVEGVASSMDTTGKGQSIVVLNPLNIDREDIVEATVGQGARQTSAVQVVGPDGREVPSQIENGKVLFAAKVPATGFAVFDIRAQSPTKNSTLALEVSENQLENARYVVKLNGDGDVSSIFDKLVSRELLSAPIRLALQTERPHDWPAWNMDWADRQKPPRAFVGGPAKVTVVERGPARVAISVERKTEDSTFVQTVRLSAGDAGNRVEFSDVIDWRTSATSLKVTFPLAAANSEATYNWDIGTIKRGNNEPSKFEVASHQWFDLTDQKGEFGTTILSDCKYGSDKPDDRTLRLTLLYTPGIGTGNGKEFEDQTTQDFGHHEILYGISGHSGDWRKGQTDWQAQRLNQPLIAFETDSHNGPLGKQFGLMTINNSRLRVLALKKAELSDEVIVRLVELDGSDQRNVSIGFASPIVSAREVDAQELPIGPAMVRAGVLVTHFAQYQPRTFAIKLSKSRTRVSTPPFQPVSLPYDSKVSSSDNSKSDGGIDEAGDALPAEMLPATIEYGAIRFDLGPSEQANAIRARGQSINLPAGGFSRVYLLAAADKDQSGKFSAGTTSVDLNIEDWTGFVGQWDTRIWTTRANLRELVSLQPGFIKPSPIAWFASHHHSIDGKNMPYSYSYLFVYPIDIPSGAKTLTLPNNDKIRILAITATKERSHFGPAQPLYDTLEVKGK